ncbi:hypothetical protein EVAR_44341_1 [Eumeta japonica]|uniref:Uncharacterized protein n=1 Tax=Eumeta variegata TaxID=151549 RepID=A0A4C1XBN6_EUMVA|nr:hypothetical protein EVAR_44341_1 [Eumeta japonica]
MESRANQIVEKIKLHFQGLVQIVKDRNVINDCSWKPAPVGANPTTKTLKPQSGSKAQYLVVRRLALEHRGVATRNNVQQ